MLGPLALAAPLLAPGDGRSYRLNDRFPLIPSGDVAEIELSPDGAWLAYWADVKVDGAYELYSLPTDGSSPPVKIVVLARALFHDAPVFSPDGARILFTTRTNFSGLRRLYSVPSDGSAPALDLVGPHVTSFAITPDSTRVLLRGDVFTANRFVLCSMPIDGSAPPFAVNSGMTAGGDVEEFAPSPDGMRVVYRADAVVDGRYDLFSARVDVAASGIQLSPVPVAGGSVQPDFRISADGSRVVYRADQSANDVFELFSVPVDGSAAALRLNAVLPVGGDVEPDFVLSSYGTRAVYRADQLRNGVVELFSVPLDASAAPVALNPVPVAGGDAQLDPLVSPDGAHVVYRGDLATDESIELFSAPIDGSSPAAKLDMPLLPDEDVQDGFLISADGARVVFVVASAAGASTLFQAPIDASSPPLALDSDPAFVLSGLLIGANGVRAVYGKPSSTGILGHLWSVPLDGSAAAIALSAGTTVGAYRMTHGGAGVAYVADEDAAGILELFARPANGAAGSLQLSYEFPANVLAGTVHSFQPAQDLAVYVADPEADGVVDLLSVPVSGRAAPLEVSATTGAPIRVSSTGAVVIGSSGTRAVFQGQTGSRLQLYSVPVDGSSAPILLHEASHAAAAITSVAASADGSRVVYLGDMDTDGELELFRAEVAVASSAQKLSGALASGGSVQTGFQVSADGALAVYVADQDADEVFELYAADGSGPPVKLSGALVAGDDVQPDPQLSADGLWVFYRADALLDGRIELFRVPSDGSAGPLALSGSFVSGGMVWEGFRLTPDATRVLFRADREVYFRIDRYTVPADGSAAPVRLNSGGNAFNDVETVVLDPSGTVAVFHFARANENQKLFAVPVDGSAAQTLLTPLSGNGRVVGEVSSLYPPAIQISPDGACVVYLAVVENLENVDLYSVPIDASALPVRLNGPRTGSGDVLFFRVDPEGRRVVYVAFVTSAYEPELFAVPIDRAREPAKLDPPLGASLVGVHHDMTFASDGASVLYRLDVEQVGVRDLYAAPLEKGPRRSGAPGATAVR